MTLPADLLAVWGNTPGDILTAERLIAGWEGYRGPDGTDLPRKGEDVLRGSLLHLTALENIKHAKKKSAERAAHLARA